MKKLFLIVLLFLILGCQNDNKEIESFAPEPCVRKYPNDDYGNWKTICEKAPFFHNAKIPQEIIFSLQEVGFLCPKYLYPSAKEINLICEDMK